MQGRLCLHTPLGKAEAQPLVLIATNGYINVLQDTTFQNSEFRSRMQFVTVFAVGKERPLATSEIYGENLYCVFNGNSWLCECRKVPATYGTLLS